MSKIKDWLMEHPQAMQDIANGEPKPIGYYMGEKDGNDKQNQPTAIHS